MNPAVRVIHLLACLLPAFAPLGAQPSGSLTLESLFHPTRQVAYVEPLALTLDWRADGSLLEERLDRDTRPAGLALRTPPGWEAKPLLNRAQFLAALAGAGLDEAPAGAAWTAPFVWNPARDAFLVTAESGLYLVDPARPGARRVTGGPGPREALRFSPDGTRVAYLKGDDLYVTDLTAPALGNEETRLTADGDREHLNGRLDWLYREELADPGEAGPGAFWWAPDSRRIAFLSLDETEVPGFTLLDERGRRPQPVSQAYPHPGEPNPVAHLGVVDLEGKVAWMDDPYAGQETLIVRVGWDPQGRLLAIYQDRTQTWLECRRFDGAGASALLVREEGRGAWVGAPALPVFLPGGFLWRSARSGFHHLYRYDDAGRLLAAVTAGPWDVRAVQGVDAAAGKVYFEATRANPIGVDAWSADLAGEAPNQNLRRLSDRPGTHALAWNPAFTAAVDRFSAVDSPPQLLVVGQEGRVLQAFESRTAPAFKALRRGRVSFQQVPARDGWPLETMLVLPPGFDPARKYPVFHWVYGGPGGPLVRNAWSRDQLWFQFLAQQGIATWVCDNRSGSDRGVAGTRGLRRGLGAQELQDQLDGLAWLKAQGWADMGRIALAGASYGGFLAGYGLTHSKAWKLGIMAAPVTDWGLYDSVYAERWLGLPEDNPDGYQASSLLRAAGGLAGPLLLIQGSLDLNVHPQHTVQFLDALQQAGLGAALTLLPGSGHSPRAAPQVWAMYQSIWDFLHKNL